MARRRKLLRSNIARRLRSRVGETVDAVLGRARLIANVGVFGALVDAYGWVGTLEVAPSLLRSPMRELVVREAALLSVSMVLALAGGLAWFVLTQWLTLVSSARRDVLGLDLNETPQ